MRIESFNTFFQLILFMSAMGYLSRSDVTLVGAAVIIIVFAIVITAVAQGATEKSFSQIITSGPVWHTGTWICTSTEEFMVHGVLIAYQDSSGLEINISGLGNQPDFVFQPREMKTFSIGGSADSTIRLTTTNGLITGFLTLQTSSDATASCEEI